MIIKGVIFLMLFAGFLLFFCRVRWLQTLRILMKQTVTSMDEASRQRLLKNRKELLEIQTTSSLWTKVEQELHYSGLMRRFPKLTPEMLVLINVVAAAGIVMIVLALSNSLWTAFGMLAVFLLTEAACFAVLKMRNMKSVERNLLKFLDFLGNYSITAGEVTGIFNQVSKYVEEPLKSALDECSYEAQVTGDVSMALLAMAEKIENRQFKELVRNMEISARYCADFTSLVNSSKKSVREYLRAGGERRAVLREAGINLALLAGMSGIIMVTVNQMIDISIWEILLFTLPGRIAVGVLCVIFLLFLRQIYRMSK